MPADLQSAPFGRSGNLPCRTRLQRAAPVAIARVTGKMEGRRIRYGRGTVSRIIRRGTWPVADPSFDIVSKVDHQEADNALNQAAKELSQRFDFRGTGASIQWAGENGVTITAGTEERCKAAIEVFKEKLIKRGISLKSFEVEDPEPSGKVHKVTGSFVDGVSSENARKIAKKIRDEGPKGVQAQIQGDQLRVSAKKKDDLQSVIAMLKGADLDVALQFTNYR